LKFQDKLVLQIFKRLLMLGHNPTAALPYPEPSVSAASRFILEHKLSAEVKPAACIAIAGPGKRGLA